MMRARTRYERPRTPLVGAMLPRSCVRSAAQPGVRVNACVWCCPLQLVPIHRAWMCRCIAPGSVKQGTFAAYIPVMPTDDAAGGGDADAAAPAATPDLQASAGAGRGPGTPTAHSSPTAAHADAQLHTLRTSAQGHAPAGAQADADMAGDADDAGGTQALAHQCHVEVCEVPSDAEDDELEGVDDADQSDEDSFAIGQALRELDAPGGRCACREARHGCDVPCADACCFTSALHAAPRVAAGAHGSALDSDAWS